MGQVLERKGADAIIVERQYLTAEGVQLAWIG